MSGKTFFDTNVLIYALSDDPERSKTAQLWLEGGGIISVESLNELAAVAKRKLGMSWEEVRDATAAVEILCPSSWPLTLETHKGALAIAERYGYAIFDSLIMAATVEALTRTGRAHLNAQAASWRRLAEAVGLILALAEGGGK